MTGSSGQPTEAILTGSGAQATFANTAGQVVVVTSNSAGTITVPISSTGDPSIPAGADVSVVSNNPSAPSTASASSGTVFVEIFKSCQSKPSFLLQSATPPAVLCCTYMHLCLCAQACQCGSDTTSTRTPARAIRKAQIVEVDR